MQWLLLSILIPYVYLLLKIFGGLKKITAFHPEVNSEIFVSVIVPCHNEEKNLPRLLSDIVIQNYDPSRFELIVADDNSSDSTFKVASEFAGIKNRKVIKSIGRGKKLAIKAGFEASKGILIITTDADCRMGEEWISTIVSCYMEYMPQMIICPLKLESRRGFFGKFQELEFLSLQGITAGTAVYRSPVMCNGANLAFSREVFYNHSSNLHYEINSGDDVFLLHSLKNEKSNKIIWLESAEAVVTTMASPTLASFLRQRARWISKAVYYKDIFTVTLAIVTFITVLFLASMFISGLFSPVLFPVFLAAFIIKSIPDFLILSDTAARYGNKKLLRWFLPSQIIYPLYIIAVVLFSVVKRR